MLQATLEKITQNLHEEKTRLEQELSTIATKDAGTEGNYRSSFPQFGSDEGENAAEVADFESRLSIEHTLEIALRDVNAALESIAAGTYGICKYCKNPIEEQRLLARPTSSSCIACKKKLTGE